MSRVEENRIFINEMNKRVKDLPVETCEEITGFQLDIITAILADLSVSLAILADKAEGSKTMTEVYMDCRDEFVTEVERVFETTEAFLDLLESNNYSEDFDVFISSDGENYIINRYTGEYINWYKFTHIGRDIHSTCKPCNFVNFLRKLKGEKND